MVQISEQFVQKARIELGETDERRQECLVEFRDWIAAHPFIKDCRQDDTFLLQFLRTRKFRMNQVYSSFENYFLYKQKYSKWFIYDDPQIMQRMWDLFDTGYAYPLMERDADGRRIIFLQANRLDPAKFSIADSIRLVTMIVVTLMEDEQTQIGGISSICNLLGTSMSHCNMLSMRDIQGFGDCMRNATIGREKENYFVGMPSVAVFLFEIAKKTVSEKMRKRLVLTQTIDDLKQHVNEALLPSEYGGKHSEAEMMASFKKVCETNEKALRAITNYTIDWSSVPKDKYCIVM